MIRFSYTRIRIELIERESKVKKLIRFSTMYLNTKLNILVQPLLKEYRTYHPTLNNLPESSSSKWILHIFRGFFWVFIVPSWRITTESDRFDQLTVDTYSVFKNSSSKPPTSRLISCPWYTSKSFLFLTHTTSVLSKLSRLEPLLSKLHSFH